MDSDSDQDEGTQTPVEAPSGSGAGEKHEEETQEKDLPKNSTENSQDVSSFSSPVVLVSFCGCSCKWLNLISFMNVCNIQGIPVQLLQTTLIHARR